MLIIGHRGSAGTKPENSIAALREAIEAGADMVECDVRLTKDGVPILAHDFHLLRTHHKVDLIALHTLKELRHLTAGSESPVVTLEAALKECVGQIMLNIELKQRRAVEPTLEHLQKVDAWDEIMISSFFPRILRAVRRQSDQAQLALLHHLNPYTFAAWARPLQLSAVGFHRLYAPHLAIELADQMNLLTYAYTVNRLDAARRLEERGLDGVVTDFPARLAQALQA